MMPPSTSGIDADMTPITVLLPAGNPIGLSHDKPVEQLMVYALSRRAGLRRLDFKCT
jgi:hypothetical protein